MKDDDASIEARLTAWLTDQIPGADDVRVDGLDRVDFGHSAEMLMVSVTSTTAGEATVQDVVVKLQPPSPGLLEPYDLARQHRILRALEPTEVRAPRALWLEPSGEVLGRPFYVMERVTGQSYERQIPPELDDDPVMIPRMCEEMIDQLVAIHQVDLPSTGLDGLGDGSTYIDRQLDHWAGEMRRVQRGPLPALERLLEELHRQRPEPSPYVTLVHGDVKPGNFGFVDGRVSAVFDWEMTDVGDPLADIGYLEQMWAYPVGITSRPTAPSIEEMLARYQERSGIEVANRSWYRAFQGYKLAVIMLVGSMLFDAGHSDDMRYFEMALGIDFSTHPSLKDLGVEEHLESGPVLPSDARIQAAQERAATTTGR
jgi:aminoglycoside phosphotransferase (APT) family kinase protein